jgi:hypothetical protein
MKFFFHAVLVRLASPFGLVRELKITSPFFRNPLLNLFTTFYVFASQCPPDVVLHEISIAIPVLEAQKIYLVEYFPAPCNPRFLHVTNL